MLRAMIGAVILSCIQAHDARQDRLIMQAIDLSKMTDQDVSDWIHGRRLREGCPGVTPVTRKGMRRLLRRTVV